MRVVFFRQIADALQVGDRAVHRENAVGRDETEARTFGRLQLRLEISHVAVLVTIALCFAEPHTVNDAGVIQLVGDDRVLRA